ncbi:MAG: fructose-bisphosphatase class II family protein [Chloroflexi bacterium]|nr:MAG: fructose-bisphosphatase class II family protein [Chloroflexota bacterium]TMD71290.1 MAG: fructose-bisphosphatase class II family protein [Chloroflexota bacterium]
MEQQRGGTTSFDAAPSPPGGGTSPQAAKRDLSLELVHVTEAATLVCAPFLGKGDPDRVSEAAGAAMRAALDGSGLAGTVVLSPRHQTHLPHGMVIGGGDRKVDLGVYAVEGASQVARGHINSVSTVVAVEPGGFARLPAVAQVEKFVAGPAARGAIDLDDSIADNLRRIAFAHNVRVQDLTVAILERPRHQELIAEVAATGARIRTLEEGDFASSVMAALPGTGIDAAIGIGDLHATLIAACAVRCLGGEFVARLLPRNDEEKGVLGDAASHVFSVAELAPAADIAVAITGVTGGPLLPGVSFGSGYAETASLVMSSRHATVRRLTTRHQLAGQPS